MNIPTAFTHVSWRAAHKLAIAIVNLALAIIVALATRLVFAADVISTWDGTSNNWTSSHWSNIPSSSFFPNNGNGGFTYDAVINGGTVTLNQSIAHQTLSGSGGTLVLSASYTYVLARIEFDML